MPLDLQTATVAVASSLGIWWLFFRQRLSHIPGPPNPSWLIGMLISQCYYASCIEMYLLGNLIQLFNENAWSFHAYVYKTFGAVTRIHTMFNVTALGVNSSS